MRRKLLGTMFSVMLAVCLMGNTVSANELGTANTEKTYEAVIDNSSAETMDVSAGDAVQEYTAEVPAVGAATGLTYTVEGDTVTITGEGTCWTSGSALKEAIKSAAHVIFKKCKIQGSMREAFNKCSNLQSIDLSGLDTSQVTDMRSMFAVCNNLTSLDVSGFDTSQVKDMGSMFSACNKLMSLDIGAFDTSQVAIMSGMFSGCGKLASLDVSGFDTSQVKAMDGMFAACSNLTSLDVSGFDTSQVKNMGLMFYECSNLTSLDVSGFDTSKVTDMSYMFNKCSNLTSLDVSGFNTSKVTGMAYMFDECSNLTSLDVSGFDTSQVVKMCLMFDECSKLTSLDVSGFDTSKVTDMGGMFGNCRGLTALDVSGFDTSKVMDMSRMFYGCVGLMNLDVSDFDTSKVTAMKEMFGGCSELTVLDVSGFDTSKVTNMSCMFLYCKGLMNLDVSGFDTSKVTDMSCMFIYCSGLTNLDLSSFDMSKVTNQMDMLNNCSLQKLCTPKVLPTGCSIALDKTYQNPAGVKTKVLTPEFAGTTLTLYVPPVDEQFRDVQTGAWYVSAIQYVYDNGIMTGKTATTFAPNANLTRAEFTTVLYSQAGKPAVTYQPIFKDVEQGAWYSSPVLWAYDKGIVSGYTNGCFGTSDKITREQLALMMYKYAQMKGYDTTADADILSSFSDEAAISNWARGAIQWAASRGIMSGKGKGTDGKPMLDPKGNATRAECAAMIKKLLTME